MMWLRQLFCKHEWEYSHQLDTYWGGSLCRNWFVFRCIKCMKTHRINWIESQTELGNDQPDHVQATWVELCRLARLGAAVEAIICKWNSDEDYVTANAVDDLYAIAKLTKLT